MFPSSGKDFSRLKNDSGSKSVLAQVKRNQGRLKKNSAIGTAEMFHVCEPPS